MQQVSAEPPHLERADIAQSAIKKLDDIIQRCLAKSPKDRYQTVKALAQAVSYFSTRN
jgi:serine/threonine protein kinase